MNVFGLNRYSRVAVMLLTAVAANISIAQISDDQIPETAASGTQQNVAQDGADSGTPSASQGSEVVDKVKDTVVETAGIVKDKANEIGQTLDQSQSVVDVSNSILNPIYQAAESAGQYPMFYWCAFTLMAAGVVSFLLQLLLTKLFLLFRMHLNLEEMIMDGVGLAISVVGLILTTQAASENSASFVQSPSAVLSAVGIGAVLGIVFYIWGQRQEFQAAEGYAAAKAKET
ncbi:hypothetical protein [Mariniblastus fucicola]|uniref:Uncharacterized protein n=1 Tax=Mariniblastus fucicola TaxID=980251 RepID=A0A5B9PMD7_9BACT|nr:hypothetical protein [Mariniblastus fucicola]QEG23483.1 hypothetical protein MFFC18_33820 [Mariniblastus fucicola]